MTEETRAEAMARVEQEARDNADEPAPNLPDALPAGEIEAEEMVFQQRATETRAIGASMGHVEKLMDAIRQDPDNRLEPIAVWWSGSRWIVVDGHHRLRAYNRISRDPKRPIRNLRVPVERFEGSFDEALRRSLTGNVKDKLPMDEEEKSDAAWRFTCRGETASPRWPKKVIMEASSRSEGTISSRRRVRKDLVEMIRAGEIEDLDEAGLMEISWDEARRLAQGEGPREWDEERLDKLAAAYARKLRKAFKDRLSKSPEVFAKALLYYDDDLPKALIQAEPWDEVHGEIEEEMEAAREEDGDVIREF